VLRTGLQDKVRLSLKTLRLYLRERLANRQRKSKAGIIGEHHYDLGNDLFRAMLDRRMVYSCAYWDGAANLDEAQENKLDLICRKLGLEQGMTVLDIGCGWGSFARFAAERYGVSVVGINNSKEQVDLGRKLVADLPVEIRFQDYRDVTRTFDRIVSIGMFEHVGPKNHKTYMRVVERCLKDEGLFLLHTIATNQDGRTPDAWIEKYIFPRSTVPTAWQISKAFEGLFVMEDWQNLSVNYDRTLLAWHKNFTSNWESLRSHYDQRFYRMWNYYLLCCAGAFRSRYNQVYQVVLSKKGVSGGYQPIR
jgi:cyclopropane-fatty-acyl-phospholipid synthase